MDVLLFAAGGLLLIALVRSWHRPLFSWRVALGYQGLVLAFFAPALLTPALQLPTDIAYQAKPWGSLAELGPEKVVAQNPLLSDVVFQMLPFRTLARQRWLALEAPLWAHELGTGQPLLGNAQASPWAPLHMLALPLPPLRAMTVAAAWQVLLALLFTHLLARLLGASVAGAALAALGYAFSTFAVAWCYYPMGMTAAFLPGVLAGIALLFAEARGGAEAGPHGAAGAQSAGSLRSAVGLGATALGMALSGHPETLAHAALLSALLVVFATLRLPGQAERRRFLTRTAWAGTLAFGLAAPALLPILEVLPETERSHVLAESSAAVEPLPPSGKVLSTLLNPLAMGSPRDANWRGPGNFNEVATAYAGVLVLALALAGALALGGRVLALVASGGLALAGALGLPPVFPLLVALPVLGDGAHARLRLLWILALALAAGLSFERLRAEPRPRLVALATLAALGLALLLLPPAGGGTRLPPSFWQNLWHGVALAGLLGVAGVLSVPRLRKLGAGVALAALLADLFLLGMRYNPTLPARLDLGAPGIVETLRQAVEVDRKEGLMPRLIAEGWDFLPNLAVLYGLWDVRASDPMRPAEAALAVSRRLDPAAELRIMAVQGRRYDAELHRFLAIRYVLAPNLRRLPAPWQPLGTGNGLSLWRLPEAGLPFFVPAEVRPVATLAEARQAFAESSTLTSAATWLAAATAPPREQQGRVRLLAWSANGVELEVETRTGALVTSSLAKVRGWKAWVDGEATATLTVQAGFLGLEVPPGTHHVRLAYQPISWRLGLLFAGLSLAALLGLAWRRLKPLPPSARANSLPSSPNTQSSSQGRTA